MKRHFCILALTTLAVFLNISVSSSQTYTIEQLTNNSYYDGSPQINSNGYVVWNGWDGADYEIFLYDGSAVTQLTNNSFDDLSPQINENGYVVWNGLDGTDYEIFLAKPDGNTFVGNNVVVEPVDVRTGETPVMITFDEVTNSGTTTVTTTNTGAPLPPGFQSGNPPTYFEIETTANYSGPIKVCIDYSDASYINENNLKLFHEGYSGWEEVTSLLNTESNIICGTTNSLSSFAVLEPAYTFIGFFESIENPPMMNYANAGRTISIKWQIIDENGGFIGDLAAVTSIQFQQVSCSDFTIQNSLVDAVTSGNSGIHYDTTDNQFIYTWKTNKSMAGKCYVLAITLYNFDKRTAYFEMK